MIATPLLDVLIVDDSAAIRKILQRVLRQMDLQLGEIHEAGDGREAVEILKSRRVGLVLSDMNMPHMDGLELLARIKEMEHMNKVPIVMITTEGPSGKGDGSLSARRHRVRSQAVHRGTNQRETDGGPELKVC